MKNGEQNIDLLLEDETLRDGLQMESRVFSLDEKRHIFNLLKKAGVRRIQVGSFVNPKRVPQMATTDEFIEALDEEELAIASGLILNAKGLERAIASGIRHASMSVSVSDTHSRKNVGVPARDALEKMVQLIKAALDSGIAVRGGLQCAFGCVYEGSISADDVIYAAEQMAGIGVKELNLADTTGMATPGSVRQLIKKVQAKLPGIGISLHLHDTRGAGMANMFSAYELGIRTFDVCSGGLGGCPFVKGAAGNIPTEDAINFFESMGIPTGVDLEGIALVVEFLESILERNLPGHMRRVLNHRN